MENIAFFVENHSFFVLLVFCLWIFALSAWLVRLQIQIKKQKKFQQEFFSGKKVNNMEDLLLEQAKNIKALDKDIQELYDISNRINNLASRGFHKFGLVRFNPFKEVGGDQSFSLAILNGKNNGITITSLFTREGTRVYSKNIAEGKSEKYALSQEEEKAISLAVNPILKEK
jgi:hypothetical protein